MHQQVYTHYYSCNEVNHTFLCMMAAKFSTYVKNMIKIGHKVHEIRLHLCLYADCCLGVREFVDKYYLPLKSHNPDLPFLIRECRGITPQMIARYGGTGSNACTIITLLMAHKIHSLGIQIWGHEDQPLNRQLISAFAESIIDGNDIHERLMASGPMRNPNLTLPEAMDACRGRFNNLVEWDSTVFHSKLRATLFDNLHRGIVKWELQGMPPSPSCDLYIVLIADQRSVLLVFQRGLNRVTLIDSHSHLQHGAVVAQTSISHLKELCIWYDDMCWRFYESRPCCYELSYLYFQSPTFPTFSMRRPYRTMNSRW